MGFMLAKEIYIYFACVQRADDKIRKERRYKSMKAGFQSLLQKAALDLQREN